MFPRTTVKFTSFNNLLVSSVLALLAKTPTGSSTTGLLYLFAAFPAFTNKSKYD